MSAQSAVIFVIVNYTELFKPMADLPNIQTIQDVFRPIVDRDRQKSIIEAEIPVSDERDEIITFVRETGRGIMKGYTRRQNEDLS